MKIIFIMGVSGSGKSTIGELLAKKLGLPFFDADDFHPETNKAKMSQGIPLTDTDRLPWLNALKYAAEEWDKKGAVLACSALKESYRQLLSEGEFPITWIYLEGTFEAIFERMKKRKDHFMRAEMLQSQFKALEVPTYGIHVDIGLMQTEVVTEILKKL